MRRRLGGLLGESLTRHLAPYDALLCDKLQVASQREEHDKGMIHKWLKQCRHYQSQIGKALHLGLRIVVVDNDERQLHAEHVHHGEDNGCRTPVYAARKGEVYGR